VRVSAAIMAHPDRTDQVRELITMLKRPVPIHWDEEGPPSGNGDRVWRQARATWELADPRADYHVLIQDDAVPCPDLLAGLERALEHVPPDVLVSPYLGKGGMTRTRWAPIAAAADEAGASWVRSHKLMWGVCIAAPVHLLPEMIEWCDKRARVPDDMRVSGWFELMGHDVWYTWPSLVDHRSVPSLTKHRAAERVAARHHTGSALDLDWSGPVTTDPMLARRMSPRSGPSRRRPVRSVTTAERTGKAGNSA
jgi:hypothetical protein